MDTAVADGRFKTLVAAAQAAGLVDTLKGKGPFTVFAPSDDAFAKLPAGTVDALLKDPAKLKDILLYHVVVGNVMAADAAKLTSANTVQGKPITIKVDGNKVMINDALVTIADIKTSNGVIHVIDKVILPPAAMAAEPTKPMTATAPVTVTKPMTATAPAAAAKDIVDTAVADGRFKTLVAAAQAAGLVTRSRATGRSRSSLRAMTRSPSCPPAPSMLCSRTRLSSRTSCSTTSWPATSWPPTPPS